MSMHSFKKIDQKEYLKKYLSGKKKKKGKKRKKLKKSTVKIVDDDINHVDCSIKIDEELLLVGEDAPQIVGEYIEEQHKENKKSCSKWKSIVIKEEPNGNEDIKNVDLWGHKAVEFNIKKEKRSITPDKFTQNKSYYKNKSDRFDESHRQQCKQRRNSTPDQSPPRKRGTGSDQRYADKFSKRKETSSTLTSQRHQRQSSSDQTPPRKLTNTSNEKIKSPKSSKHHRELSNDQSPPRRKNTCSDGRRDLKPRSHHRSSSSDQSPPRKLTNTSGEKIKSPKSSKHHRELSNDQSPPRRKNTCSDGRRDLKPRRHHRSSSSDQSPPRKLTNTSGEKIKSLKSSKHLRELSNDQSPPRQSKISSSDDSPKGSQISRFNERNRKLKSPNDHRSSSSDQSSRRKQKDRSRDKNQDLRSQRIHYSTLCDESPSYKLTRDDLKNLSPARRERKIQNHRLTSGKDYNRKFNRSPQKIKLDNSFMTSPPISSSTYSKIIQQSPSPPSTHKSKVSRTLDGKKAGLQNAAALHEETAERRLQEQHFFEQMPKELSGRDAEVQVRSTGRLGRKARQAREETSVERILRETKEQETKLKYERWGKGLKQIEDYRQRKADEEYESSKPLARYANDEDLDKYLREKEHAGDPMLEYMRQKRKEKEIYSNELKKPIYEGPYPDNRFGIRPGYRWDGVDRSNGYEKKWLTMQNERQAKQEEAYKYSVEDM